MGWLLAAFALAGACLQAWPALAANTPQVGQIPGWVTAAPTVPPEKDEAKGLPIAILLNDTQLSFDVDGWTEYHLIRAKVQTPQGLQALNAIPFVWSPWSDTLTFHAARILRDGQTIDVLPKDGVFTVLRRETGLEQSAMLTGQLTALLQPEGLQVGDVFELAVSIRHADPLLKGRTGALYDSLDASPVGLARIEAHWPSALPIRWRESAGFPPLHPVQAGGVTTVTLQLENVHPLVLPAHAPLRFQHGRQIEFTALPDWKALAQLMAPLYVQAAQLGPQSAVAAQAKRIAAASSDPKVRASEALKLVQTQVRYLAHVEAAGGYTPQTADETWRLRYGDCKAKTVLLLALLHDLGVPAEPALANPITGDGLNLRLPSVLWFNHVLVRVKLGGRDYWLDGARQGDRSLDGLATPNYGWVLPLESADGGLVHLVSEPSPEPQARQVIVYDASGGTTAPEPTKLETTFRGDAAILIHAQLSAVPPDRLDAALKAYWASVHTAFTAAHVAAAWNPDTGDETLTADGTSKLDWTSSGQELQHVVLGGAPDIKRDPDAIDPDAPYVVAFPSYTETDESLVLPPGGAVPPDTLKSYQVDQTIAGVAYRRTATVTGKVFRVVASQRALQPEISAAQARASVDPLTKLGDIGIYAPPPVDTAAVIDSHPTTVEGHVKRGNALLFDQDYTKALSEFDAAIAIDPKSQVAWGGRAMAHARLADPAANADADKADSLGKPEITAARARALLAEYTGDDEKAYNAYVRALKIDPDDRDSLVSLINIKIESGRSEEARNDVEHLVKVYPELSNTGHYWLATIELKAHHNEAAKREIALIRADTAEDRISRSEMYRQLGETDLARAELDAADKLKPSAEAWIRRSNLDGGYGSAAAAADIEAASKLSPDDMRVHLWKVNAALFKGDYAAALPILDRLINQHPEALGPFLVNRAEIEFQLRDSAKMEADFTRARALTAAAPNRVSLCRAEVKTRWRPDEALADCEQAVVAEPKSVEIQLDKFILMHRLGRDVDIGKTLTAFEAGTPDAQQLNSICYTLAVENMALDHALADCDASLKLQPDNAATLDSRGFVLLRLGRNADALTAYDAALKANPKEANSLYGRSLAEARLGRTTDSQRDQSAAIALNPHVQDDFTKMGVS